MSNVSASFGFQPPLMDVLKSLHLTPEEMTKRNKHALTAMGAWMTREMQVATTSRGQKQPGGQAWVGLSSAWLATKAAEGRSQLIGLYEGHMRDSMSFDVRMGQLEVEAGPTVEHAGRFHIVRPITPEENYAAARFRDITIDAWNK